MSKAWYQVEPHPKHDRLYHIELDQERLLGFFDEFKEDHSQRLEFVPFMRYVMAGKMCEWLGSTFMETIQGILQDRQSGGFTIGVQGATTDTEDYVKFATALAHMVGSSNYDAMSGTFYARFTVQDSYASDSYLRQAYRLFTLHTDGTFVDDPTDWLQMMKMEERHAIGGESRLLHLDDWNELKRFSKHPLASYKFLYKAPPSKNMEQVVYRPTFFKQNNATCISFIDQFVQPETIEQANYLKDLSESLDNSPSTFALKLPVGDLVMLNNTFWLHGRAAFEKNPDLYRELMRQRGIFAKV
jgi:protein CsiD